MGVRDLFFAIKARDETGAAFNNVKGNLRAVDGLAATTGQRLQRMGGNLMRLGAGASAMMSPIMFAFRDSLSLYDTQERAQAKVRQGVVATAGGAGYAADELFRMAAGLQDVTRFGDEEILNGVTAQLLTFTSIAEDQFARAQTAILDIATVLDSELQPIAIQVGKALNDPVRGLSALAKAGIQFSDDQKAVINALVQTGDVAQAQNLILQELERQYGGQAQAAADAGTGAMAQLGNSWGDLKETVGGVVADLLPPMVDFFQSLVSGFREMTPAGQKFVTIMGLVVVAAGPVALAIGGIVTAVGLMGSAMTLALGPVGLVVGAIGLIAGVAFNAQTSTSDLTGAVDDLVLAMGDEIVQASILTGELSANGVMSASVANVKLQEARSRWENVNAIIAEHRALVTGSAEYRSLRMQLDQEGPLMRNGPGPTGHIDPELYRIGAIGRRQSALGEQLTQEMADLVALPQELQDQRDRVSDNIARLEAVVALDGASGSPGVVPIIPGERNGATPGQTTGTPLDPSGGLLPPAPAIEAVGSAAGAAGAAVSGLSADVGDLGLGLGSTAENADDAAHALSGFGRETSGMILDTLKSGQSAMLKFETFMSDWGDRLLDRFLSAVFDPLGDAIQGMFDSLANGQGGGSGGVIGGLTSFFGGVFFGGGGDAVPEVAMNTGGILGVRGRSGIDRNVANFRVSDDEDIYVKKRGQPDSGRPVYVTIQTPNPQSFHASKGQISRDIGRAVGHGNRFD